MRIVYPIRRKAGMPDDEFYGYWREQHGPLVASVANDLGIRRYVQTHTLRDDPITHSLREVYGSSDDLFDGMAEVWFNDPEGRTGAASTKAGQTAGAALIADEKKFIDMSRSLMYLGTDVPQINPTPETLVAGPETPILKFVSFLWQKPEVSFAATQLHWRMNHGPLVRQLAQTLRFQRYLQVHRHNSKLADAFREVRGLPDAPVYGHAEIWFNRYDFNAAAGPELDAAFALAIDDCKLFIDLPNSIFFVAKEHVLVDRPVVTAPIPGPPEV